MSRTRTQGMLSNGWHKNTDYNPDGSIAGEITYTSTSKYAGQLKTISDTVIPNFAKRKANGEVMMNSMTLDYTERNCSEDSLNFGPHPAWGRRVASGPLACVWSIPPSRPAWFATRKSDAAARTLLRAHAKVSSENFQGLVTLAEAAKTARMLRNPFRQATELINRIVNRRYALDHLRFGQTRLDASKALASAWNEFRFGWKPILYDIEGMMEAFRNSRVEHQKPVRIVARASDTDIQWVSHSNVNVVSKPGGISATMVGDFDHEAKVSSGVLYELQDSSLLSANWGRAGLRLADLPASLWELVPHSFIVDRFVDVGVWLKAITPKPGVRILGSWTTTVDRQLNKHSLKTANLYVATPPATTYYATGGSYTEVIHEVSRVANPSLPPLPTVNYRELNLVQAIDHVALIIAALSRIKH